MKRQSTLSGLREMQVTKGYYFTRQIYRDKVDRKWLPMFGGKGVL